LHIIADERLPGVAGAWFIAYTLDTRRRHRRV
jgi:hypothetical protein